MSPLTHMSYRRRPLTPAVANVRRRLLTLAALVGVMLFGFADELCAEVTSGKLENQVKAAFLVKFAAFIEWPASEKGDTNAPFVIGLLGREPFGQEFDEVVKLQRVKDRPVEVRRSHEPAELAGCQIIYVASSERDRLDEIIADLAGLPVLLVTDEPGAAQRGSQINFVKEDGKVRFEINVAAAEQAQLKFSAKLLQVGRIVVRSPAAGRGNP